MAFIRRWGALLLVAGIGLSPAQPVTNLTTTHDGAEVFFRAGGLYRIIDGRLRAFGGDRSATSYAASADGRVVAVAADARETVIYEGETATRTLPGQVVSISPSGRYVLYLRFFGGGRFLFDRESGQETELREIPVERTHGIVSNRGDVLTRDGIWSAQEGLRRIAGISDPQEGTINAAGTHVAVTLGGGFLFQATLSGGRGPMLSGGGYGASLSANGRRMVYLATLSGVRQAFLIEDGSPQWRQLTRFPVGIIHAVISGDGRFVWAADLKGGLFRIDVETGWSQRFLATQTATLPLDLMPGMVADLEGGPFTDHRLNASFPLPETLGGVRVEIDGRAMKLISLTPTRIRFLVPADWEGRTGLLTLRLEYPYRDADSPLYRIPAEVPLSLPYPILFAGPERWEGPIYRGNETLVYHQDFSGPVSGISPARLGEIVHVYGVGLGPVDRPVDPNGPAPSTPPAWARDLPRCGSATGSAIVFPVRFAGLAPGLAGVYQISIEIPEFGFSPGTPPLVGLEIFCPGFRSIPVPVRTSP